MSLMPNPTDVDAFPPHWVCDWPDGGKQCGKPAEWYLAGVLTDRPICTACLAKVTPQPVNHYSIEHIDPKRVPGSTYEPPIGPPDPWAGMRSVHTSGFVSTGPAIPLQSVGDGRAHNSPPAEPAAPSRPPLKDAFADLASALLDLGLTKVAEWRKR